MIVMTVVVRFRQNPGRIPVHHMVCHTRGSHRRGFWEVHGVEPTYSAPPTIPFLPDAATFADSTRSTLGFRQPPAATRQSGSTTAVFFMGHVSTANPCGISPLIVSLRWRRYRTRLDSSWTLPSLMARTRIVGLLESNNTSIT